MLNRIIKFSLGNRLIVIALSAILLIGGMIALMRTEVDIFPDLSAPTVAVMTEAPGLDAEEVERLVTYPVEQAVSGARDVVTVRSSSTTGFSVVNITFSDRTDPLVARQSIAERLQQLEGSLPPTVGTPVMGPQSSILGEILIISMSSDSLSMEQLRTLADRRMAPALKGVEGVSSVAVIGGDVRQYRITLSPLKMQHLNLSLNEVIEALESFNTNSAGGILNGYGNEYTVKADVATTDVAEMASTVVRADDSGIVRLSDIASIAIAPERPAMGAASYRTKPAVILTVTKQPGIGTINLTERLMSTIDEVEKSLPESVDVDTDIFAQRDFIDRSIDNLSDSLFEGALMVIIVLFFFMMNVRATVVSVIALPMSIIVTILILNALGMTVNTMSLGGIAIAIGSLVDDAIVDVENVDKRLRQNRLLPSDERRSVLAVVFDASREVRMPIFNSSLIIVAGFMPLFFLSGVEGRMLIPLGVAFIVSLAASTVVALTLTPVISSYLLAGRKKIKHDEEPVTARRLKKAYSRGLSSALRHKTAWLVATGVLLVVAAILLMTSGGGFLPSFNEGSFTINVSAMPGISLQESDRLGRMAEEIILEVPEITCVARKTGRAELDEHSLGTNVSEIEAPYHSNGRSRAEIATDLRHRLSVIPGVNIEVGQPVSHRIDAMLSGSESPVVFKIFGDNLDELNLIANAVKAEMSHVEGLTDIAVEQQIDRPAISIVPRRQIMSRYGVTPAQLSQAIEAALSGIRVSQVYESGYPVDIVVGIDIDQMRPQEALDAMMIDTARGKVPLSALADVKVSTSPNAVNRENSSRRILVTANVEGRDLQSAVNEALEHIDEEVSLPEGYTIELAGRAKNASESTRRLLLASLLALVVIVIVLYHEYRSVRCTLIILVNMPLAMIGGAIAIKVAGLDLDIPAIIGFIALLGIATRNGMLLISRYDALMAEGKSVKEAVAEGSADRLLPIVMTALSSALALTPLALRSGQAGNELQSPLATVIVGGLVSSTLLNLFIVPILFGYTGRNKASKKGNETQA